jgi:hypothetical protein
MLAKVCLLCLWRHRRHTTAIHLLQSGVAFSLIALWLGHESTTTTHRYVEADLAMKDKALARLQQPDTKMRRYRPPDHLTIFLHEILRHPYGQGGEATKHDGVVLAVSPNAPISENGQLLS